MTLEKYIIGENEEIQIFKEIEDDDYNVFTREDDDVDVMILKHEESIIDIYIYDRLSMDEQRFVCKYKEIMSVEFKIDHTKGKSTIMIMFDGGNNICTFNSCPIQFCNILVKELF
jgi:hypothetical protein